MELGSEYSLSLSDLHTVDDNMFRYLKEYNCIYTDSGRSALKMLVAGMKRVLLPEYICESVINCFDKENVVFYKITENCGIVESDVINKMVNGIDALFIMHYFGKVQSRDVLDKIHRVANEKGIVIIEDTTQSLFSSTKTIGDYMIASLRKWFPIPKGGVLYSKKTLPGAVHLKKSDDNERIVAMVLKDLYLNGEVECNTVYRRIFSETEKRIDMSVKPELLSDVSRWLLSCFSVNQIIKKRKSNYMYLKEALGKIGVESVCNINREECPFVFPIRITNRDMLRQYLITQRIYCAVHWPFDGYQINSRVQAFSNARELISLPIDQRYGMTEMDYLIETLKKFGGDLCC